MAVISAFGSIVLPSLDSFEKTTEGAWKRVRREFRLGLSTASFAIPATLIVAATGALFLSQDRAASPLRNTVVALLGAFAGLVLSAALYTCWLVVRAPYWQRDEAREQRDLLQKQLDGLIPESAIRRDVDLFKEFMALLPSDSGTIPYLKDHDFGARFFYAQLDPLREFAVGWDNAEHEFNTPQVEQLRKGLLQAAGSFNGLLAAHTFTVQHEKGSEREKKRGEVPREWMHNDPPRYRNVVQNLNNAADQIVEAHQELVRQARLRLPP